MGTYRTTCKIGACEPFCGLTVGVEAGRMVSVRPDPAHPVTRGYVCLKGMHVADYQNDPDRLLTPEKRTRNGWAEIDWDSATREIGRKLREIRDGFLLLGMLRRIVSRELQDQAFVARHCAGWDELERTVGSIDVGTMGEVTGLPQTTIERLADEFAAADGAFATSRVGVQTGPNCTLTEWAVQLLNAVTGNVDRPGGVYFNPGAIDVPALIAQFTRRRNPAPSRVGGYPQIFGGPPAAVLAEDVLSDDPQRIRALVVIAGNPAITFPNTARIEHALRRLDLLVCIDLYRSDTGSFAHYNLPAATMYEKGTFHFLTSTFEPYPYAEWQPKVVEPRGEARSEWEIVKDIARAAEIPFLNNPFIDRAARLLETFGGTFSEDLLYRYLLLGKTTFGKLKRASGGIKFGDIVWGEFLRSGLRTADRRIQMAPTDLLAALSRVLETPPLPTLDYPFLLISGARRSPGYNSWTHNLPALMEKMKGNWATLHPSDARDLDLTDGSLARITTPVGTIDIPLRTSPDIRPGVVAVHQF